MPRPLLQILFALTVVSAINYYWYYGSSRTSVPADTETSKRQESLPRTYIKTARIWSFDESGKLSEIIEADLLEQFPQRNRSLITEPRFYSHSEDDKTWSASAKRGHFVHSTERLVLRDTVVLYHDQTGTKVESHALDIHLNSRIAESRRKVTITQNQNRTTADGMVANLGQETIQLKPNVESIYVKPPEPAQP